MKTALRVLCIIAIVTMMGATVVMAGQNAAVTASPEDGSSATPGAYAKPLMLAQNANYVACYKEKCDMSKVLFRWCPVGFPWTATNDKRTLMNVMVYVTDVV
jgi:hypothetical protein